MCEQWYYHKGYTVIPPDPKTGQQQWWVKELDRYFDTKEAAYNYIDDRY